jgi:RES domain-containing protein
VGRTQFAKDLTGEGAKLYGGRWNHKLTPCLYTAETRALAVLEYTVNVNIEEIPRALSITTLDVPSDNILQLSVEELPGNWQESPAPMSTKNLVTALLKAAEYPVIQIPSTVIPAEFNYIINPLHPSATSYRIISIADFIYDVRIKLV